VEAQSAAKEHTSEARGNDRGPGIRGPGADLGQRWSRYQRGHGAYACGSSGNELSPRISDFGAKKNIHEIGQGFCLQFWHLWARRNPFPGLKLKKNSKIEIRQLSQIFQKQSRENAQRHKYSIK